MTGARSVMPHKKLGFDLRQVDGQLIRKKNSKKAARSGNLFYSGKKKLTFEGHTITETQIPASEKFDWREKISFLITSIAFLLNTTQTHWETIQF